MLPFLIEEFEKNPQLPHLLNPQIPQENPRNIFIALDNGNDKDSIDFQTFYSLVDLLDVKRFENVTLCGKNLEQNKDVLEMIDRLDSLKNHSTILLENSKLDCPEYKNYINSKVDEFWIKPDADEKKLATQFEQIKELLLYRTNHNPNLQMSILLPIKDNLWNANLVQWIKDNLTSTDKILLYEDESSDPKTVLEKIRQFNLSAFTLVVSYSKETYETCKDVFMFENQDIFFIDKFTLKGEKTDLSKVIHS